jgi:hypothetical protein
MVKRMSREAGPAKLLPGAWIPISPSAEAQVEETLHQFKFDSSQGEGNV